MSFVRWVLIDVKAAQATTKTLALTNYKQKGFTLIEVMVVMAIIAAIITIGVSQINKGGNEVKETLRKISTLSKQLHSLAKLNTSTYRIVFDLGSGGEDATQSYWVERATGAVVLSSDDFSKKYEEQQTSESSEEAPPPAPGGFVKDEKVVKGQRSLPNSVRFVSVESPSFEDPILNGQAYVYFFPQGLADEALVQIKGANKNEFTLAVRPLNGKMDIITGFKTRKDLQQ